MSHDPRPGPRAGLAPYGGARLGTGCAGSRRSLQARLSLTLIAVAILGTTLQAQVQEPTEPPLIDVEHYEIDARVDLNAQLLEATAEVHFVPRDPARVLTFELHNSLNLDSVEAEDGTILYSSRGVGKRQRSGQLSEPAPGGRAPGRALPLRRPPDRIRGLARRRLCAGRNHGRQGHSPLRRQVVPGQRIRRRPVHIGHSRHRSRGHDGSRKRHRHPDRGPRGHPAPVRVQLPVVPRHDRDRQGRAAPGRGRRRLQLRVHARGERGPCTGVRRDRRRNGRLLFRSLRSPLLQGDLDRRDGRVRAERVLGPGNGPDEHLRPWRDRQPAAAGQACGKPVVGIDRRRRQSQQPLLVDGLAQYSSLLETEEAEARRPS